MAIVLNNQKSALRLYFNVGLNEKGEPIYKGKTFSGVKPAALDTDVYDVAGILANLQAYPLGRVNRANQADLENTAV